MVENAVAERKTGSKQQGNAAVARDPLSTLNSPSHQAQESDDTDGGEFGRKLPYNMLAEQAVLGSLLTNNDYAIKLSDFLLPKHFYEPVHQRIYKQILQSQERGLTASPISLKPLFDADLALKELGGASYLAKLASMVTSVINVVSYGRMIYDLALKRELIAIGEETVNDAYDHQKDSTAEEQIEQAEQRLFTLASEGSIDKGFQSLGSSVNDAMKRAEMAYKRKEAISGIPTRFADMDHLLGGLQNSDLLILAGRPSMGKTALAVNMALNATKSLREEFQKQKQAGEISPEQDKAPSVGFFSLEMSSEQLASRMLAMVTKVNSAKLRLGSLTEDEFAALVKGSRELHDMAFFIDDTPAISISALRTRARRLKRQHNLALLVVDYLQLMRGSSKASDANRVQEVSEITQGLKAIAKELNIPVIALSQLSRAVEQREDKRPQLSDLRESGSIEQDADIVMFIYRHEYYLSRKQPEEGTETHAKWQADMDKYRNKTDVIIAKQRHGPIGTVSLHFDANTTLFSNLADISDDTYYYQ